jgi:hypothetical protein
VRGADGELDATNESLSLAAAFSGFVAGRMATMQEFGFGLAAAILFDATLIRAVLVPSLMALFGRYNWWLPSPLAKLVRVERSPLAERGRVTPGGGPSPAPTSALVPTGEETTHLRYAVSLTAAGFTERCLTPAISRGETGAHHVASEPW